MRYQIRAVSFYLVLMTLWVYGVVDRYESGGPWLMPVVVFLQVAVGFASGRWWIVGLPVIVVLISVPAGYPPTAGGEPFPLFFGLAFASLFAIPLVVAGIVTRKIYESRRASRVAT
jgi:hypothetical protein